MTDMTSVAPTNAQVAVLRYRGHFNILNAGGRGSGKTFGMLLAVLDHLRLHGGDARPLVLREQWLALQEIQSELLALCAAAFGDAKMNRAQGTITVPGGGVITFSNVADENSYSRHQGRSYSGLFADEVGNFPPQALKFLTRVRSNLRAPEGRRVEICYTANPHGRSHTVILREYISKAPPWHPFQAADGGWWVWCTSTLADNPHIDQVAYRQQLIASTGGDDALADAWINGTWSVLGGVMFDAFDPAVHIIKRPAHADYKFGMGGDWGTAAPATAILLGQLRADVGPYRYGSIICLDETDTADPRDLSVGNGAPPQMFAEQIKEMGARHGWPHPRCVMDDARGLQSETVIQLLRENGIGAHKPVKKDRTGQWALIRALLSNAVSGDGPGLYLTPNCPHLIETLPEAPRGTLRAEDIDPRWDRDHWVDALAYGTRDMWGHHATSGTHFGMY